VENEIWENTKESSMKLKGQNTHGSVDKPRKGAKQEYKSLFNLSIDMLCIAGFDGYFKKLNPSWEKTLGWTNEELLSKPHLDFVHPQDRESTNIAAKGLEGGKSAVIFENRYLCKDGSYKWIAWNSFPQVKEGLIFAVARDVTRRKKIEEELRRAHDELEKRVQERTAELQRVNEALNTEIDKRKQVEEALRESEEKYRTLVESTEDSLYLVDRNFKYLFMNKEHISRMGFSGDEYLGHAYSEFHTPDETKWFVENVNEVFDTGRSIRHEHKSLRDGRYFLQTLSPVKKPDGTITTVTVISKDITELKSMEEKLRALSLTDELTCLYNRRGFLTLGEQLLKQSKRQKTGIFMLYADVDNLKEINDTFGHQEGDLALIEIANILKKNYRESDILARIGGDEFVVIPVGTTGDNIELVTARLQKSFEIHNEERNRSYKLSLSVGTAYYDPEHPCSIDELLIQGDKLMYEQKRHTRKS